jgi:hypothetical protein
VVTKGVTIKGGLLYLHNNNNNSGPPPKVPKILKIIKIYLKDLK